MIWAAIALFGVIAVKYYTAVGSRNLEQRLNREIIDDLGTRIKGKEKKEEPVKKRERPPMLMQY